MTESSSAAPGASHGSCTPTLVESWSIAGMIVASSPVIDGSGGALPNGPRSLKVVRSPSAM